MFMNELQELLMERSPGEHAAFCYHCGGMMAPATIETGSHKPIDGRCMECGKEWCRLFTPLCPRCPGGGWSHMQAPITVDGSDRFVETAVDTCWCDSCAEPSLYRWQRKDGNPEIVVVGFYDGDAVRSVSGQARDAIYEDS